RYRATRTTMFQIAAAEFLAGIVFSGALDRFPGFKFVLGEAGVSWLPYILDRMDEEYEDRYHQLTLSMKPSELWRRQGYSTYQHEPSVAVMIPLIGEDNIMWGSDYPHPDGIWPDSQKWIAEDPRDEADYAGVHHFGFMVDDVDGTCRKLEAAGAKAMTNRTDPQHASAAGARSYYEIKFRGPDNQEFDVTASGWITG